MDPALADVWATFACLGKFEARGRGDPISDTVAGSAAIVGSQIHLSFRYTPCNITSTSLNGV